MSATTLGVFMVFGVRVFSVLVVVVIMMVVVMLVLLVCTIGRYIMAR